MNMDVSKLPLTKRPLRCLVQSNRPMKKPRGRPTAVCGVCGDEAKHIHFGGLCCPSCKAFFRRVVQLNLKDSLTCTLNNNCVITTKNRRDCPNCRFKKCESIGMLFNWVMPEEERKRMMERRIVATKRVLERIDDDDEATDQQLETGSNNDTTEVFMNKKIASNQNSEARLEKKQTTNNTNETNNHKSNSIDLVKNPKTVETKKICIKQEIKVEEEELLEITPSCSPTERSQLRLTLSEAFLNCEFPTESSLDESERFPQIFFWYCQALSVFFHNIEDFKVLNIEEKSKMIKYAVTRSIFLYSAHQFDDTNQTFPRFKLNSSCSFPTIKLKKLELFIDNKKVFLEIKNFLTTVSGLLEDEIITLYLMIVSFLTTDDAISETAKLLKEKFRKQFEDYLKHQKETKKCKPTQYYYDLLEDVDKLAKVFGEMKLPADKIVANNSLQNVENDLKVEPEETPLEEDINVSDTESRKADREEPLKTIVQIDHDYSMSIASDESNHTRQQNTFSKSTWKNKAEAEESLQNYSRKVKQHRHPFYQKSNKYCSRSCCNETNFHRKHYSHLEFPTTCSPEYQRHAAYHTSNDEIDYHIPERTVCPPLTLEECLPNHLSRLEEEHIRGLCKCYRRHQCCPSPTSPFQRYEPIWDNCGISHHRWSQHYQPTKESRSCYHTPWNHESIDRYLHH